MDIQDAGERPSAASAEIGGAQPGVPDPGSERRARRRSDLRSLARSILAMAIFLIGLAVVWEAFKWLAGDPWRYPEFGYVHFPPFHLLQASDLQLPHIWDIVAALARPVQRNSPQSLGQFLFGAALFTWREALIGFLIGALVGIGLATLFVHSRLAERAFVPYVIASQTIPIVALAPLIAVSLGQGLASIVLIATYLTFFPVTIAEIRGLRSPDPRSLELMRSYAASRWEIYWKLRLPASTPYLFTGAQDRGNSEPSSARSSVRIRAVPQTASGGRSSTSTSSTSPARRSCGRRSWWLPSWAWRSTCWCDCWR